MEKKSYINFWTDLTFLSSFHKGFQLLLIKIWKLIQVQHKRRPVRKNWGKWNSCRYSFDVNEIFIWFITLWFMKGLHEMTKNHYLDFFLGYAIHNQSFYTSHGPQLAIYEVYLIYPLHLASEFSFIFKLNLKNVVLTYCINHR